MFGLFHTCEWKYIKETVHGGGLSDTFTINHYRCECSKTKKVKNETR